MKRENEMKFKLGEKGSLESMQKLEQEYISGEKSSLVVAFELSALIQMFSETKLSNKLEKRLRHRTGVLQLALNDRLIRFLERNYGVDEREGDYSYLYQTFGATIDKILERHFERLTREYEEQDSGIPFWWQIDGKEVAFYLQDIDKIFVEELHGWYEQAV